MTTQVMDFVKEFIEKTKQQIIELARTTLANEEKKAELDAYITNFVETALETMKLGWFGRIVIKKWCLPHLPELTQCIYDLLKAKLEELVK